MSRRFRISRYLFALLAIPQLYGCGTEAFCDHSTKSPDIDWADISERMRMAIDVGNYDYLTDQQVANMYTTSNISAMVRRPSTNQTRYLLLVQESSKTQHIIMPGVDLDNLRVLLAAVNANPVMVPELGIELHSGFNNLARQVRSDVEPLLNHDYETRVTGYSLGGAVASILSLYLSADGFAIASAVTFGQPKVTTSNSAEIISSVPLVRFIAGHDIVPTFFLQSYVHFGEEIILLDGPQIVFLPRTDLNYMLSTDSPADAPKGPLNFDDHGTYLDRLASKVDVPVTEVSFCAMDLFINGL